MRILLWHVHGSWTTAFVQGSHDYFVPVTSERDARGLGRATSWQWPESVREVTPAQLAELDLDLIVLQRPEELRLCRDWLGRTPGREVPAVYVEHNAPRGGETPGARHPLADRDDIPLVHVTHFNELMWDSGRAPTSVIEHGIVDPGPLYTGELPRAAVVVNEPVRRWRVTGTDLLPRFAAAVPLDVFGMQVDRLADRIGVAHPRLRTHQDLPQHQLHTELARRRVYLHPIRWTSLGLSLLEAMHLGMPVVALATTEVPEAVPADAGVISTDVGVLVEAVRWLTGDAEAAARLGKHARAAALSRYGLVQFLQRWDRLLAEVRR